VASAELQAPQFLRQLEALHARTAAEAQAELEGHSPQEALQLAAQPELPGAQAARLLAEQLLQAWLR